MKKLILIPLVLLISGCSWLLPAQRKFPDMPASLSQQCPDLKLVPADTTKATIVLDIVADNYLQYHECKAKVDGWSTWYTDQKKIFESVK